MAKPIVAVVGRPNVGKSTLINRIAQTSEAITHEDSGVTRDRSYYDAEWNGVEFTLIDTGGIEISSNDTFQKSISKQAQMACLEADVVVFLTDGQVGPNSEDEHVARLLKKSKSEVILVVNKLDNPADESGLWDFYSLGVGDPLGVSAMHGHGTGDLLDIIVSKFPDIKIDETRMETIDVAIIGRPNAGKSSLTNMLAKEERSIVSDVAGTTRDAIDTIIEHEGVIYRLIDTAGLRKKSNIKDDVEYYGYVRSLRAVDCADVALLVVDSEIGITDQDQKIAALAHEKGCALVILLNKWDLLDTSFKREHVMNTIERNFYFVSYAPIVRISAKTGRSLHRIWDAINVSAENRAKKISTSALNELLQAIREAGHTVTKGGRTLRVNYVTQTSSNPPEFTYFANSVDLVTPGYERYIENSLRATFDFTGTPIRVRFKNKQKKDL